MFKILLSLIFAFGLPLNVFAQSSPNQDTSGNIALTAANTTGLSGIINGSIGTQVITYGTVNSGTATIYTVPASVSFYVSSFNVSSLGNSQLTLEVLNGSSVLQYFLAVAQSATTNEGNFSQVYFNPIVIPTGYIIKLIGSGGPAFVTLTGWTK
jgi:hypothetical protein